MVIERMSHTLGELIKSPHYAHPRDYENEINSLPDLINELSSHTMDKKRALLERKRK